MGYQDSLAIHAAAARRTQIGEGAVLVSLGDGATYEIFCGMFNLLAGWNISLNGEDVNVVRVTVEGMWCRVPLDDEWMTFGLERFLAWEAIERIVVF
jgi:hypothetical protein